MNKLRPSVFISLIRDSHPEMTNIYTKGSCLNFYLILKSVYPESVPYTNTDHIITRIGNFYYDITGLVSPKGFIKYKGEGFSQMLKAFHQIK